MKFMVYNNCYRIYNSILFDIYIVFLLFYLPVQTLSGFSASVLDQWRKYYPHSEESVKTIAHKLSKFDRGPDPDLDANGVKITSKGRVMWSQIMLNNLQEAKKIATEKV